MDVDNTGVRVEITEVGIKTPGFQDTPHEDSYNEDEDNNKINISDKDIPE